MDGIVTLGTRMVGIVGISGMRKAGTETLGMRTEGISSISSISGISGMRNVGMDTFGIRIVGIEGIPGVCIDGVCSELILGMRTAGMLGMDM